MGGRGLVVLLRWVSVLVVVWAAVSACRAELPTEREVKLSSPAGERTAIVYHPKTARPGAPLVVMLHGANGNAAAVREWTGWDALAERDGFVVAYPQALDDRWNAGSCCRRSDSRKVDDLAFLHELRQHLIDEDGVNEGRVFAVGTSNGGMLAYAWACTRPGDLAAIGVVSGAMTMACDAPTPITVVAVHGTADDVVPLAGGTSEGGPGKDVVYPSIDESLAPFLAAAKCPPDPKITAAGTATVAMWQCPGGRAVVRDVIEGEGHGWPGAGKKAGKNAAPTNSTGFLWSALRNVAPTTG